MIDKYLYGLWLLLTLLSAAGIFVYRFERFGKAQLTLSEVLDLALAVLGGLSGAFLIYQTWAQYEALAALVKNEGIVAMALGGIASLWFGGGKVKELAVKRPV